jgi:hypothetical protein
MVLRAFVAGWTLLMMYDYPTHEMFNMPFAIALGIPLVSPSLDKELNTFSHAFGR